MKHKKYLALFLAISMSLSNVNLSFAQSSTGSTAAALSEAVTSPDAVTTPSAISGDGWSLSNDGVLTILSDDGMADWVSNKDYYCVPPNEYLINYVKQAVIAEGVTKVSSHAFYNAVNLTQADLPETLNMIEWNSFKGCISLSSIDFPQGLKTIDNFAFDGCESLKEITIPQGVETIGAFAFTNCTSITYIEIPESVTELGDGAFKGCSSLERADIYANIYILKSELFSDCVSLSHIENYANIGDIEGLVFKNCKSLTEFYISDNVTRLGYGAFWGCEKLESIHLSKNLYQIRTNTFSGCTSLKNVNAVTVDEVECEAFKDCISLEEIEFNDYVFDTTVSDNAFVGCTSLKKVTLPMSVTKIGTNAFNTDNNDVVIYCDYGSYAQRYAIDNHIKYEIAEKPAIDTSLYWNIDENGVLTIENDEGMSNWVAEKFNHGYEVKKVIVSGNVTTISVGAFDTCYLMKSAEICEGVKTIGGNAFFDCDKLENITMADSVTTIGEGAFMYCDSLASVKLSQGLTTLGNSAFLNCWSLETIEIPDNIRTIRRETFSSCSNLTYLKLPANLAVIESSAFFDCMKLKSVIIPGNTYKIGDNAFCSCTSLDYVIVPKSIKTIDICAFGSYSMTSENLVLYCEQGSYAEQYAKNNNYKYAYAAYDENTDNILWTLSPDDGKLNIKNDSGLVAWNSTPMDEVTSSSITQVQINVGVSRLDSDIFAGCNNITSIIIPDSVAYIGDDALTTGGALTITCSPYSAAFSYAQQNNINCNIVGFAGDINADGNLTSSDASYLLQKVLDSSFETPYENNISKDYMKIGDTNADSSLTASDASYIIQKVLDSSFEML